jgi:hypothetical protein
LTFRSGVLRSSADRRTWEVVAKDVVSCVAGPDPSHRAGLAEAHAVAEAFSREDELVARSLDGEQRAPQRLRAEGAGNGIAENFAADDEGARAAKDDLFGAPRRVAAADLDAIEPGADGGSRIRVQRGAE